MDRTDISFLFFLFLFWSEEIKWGKAKLGKYVNLKTVCFQLVLQDTNFCHSHSWVWNFPGTPQLTTLVLSPTPQHFALRTINIFVGFWWLLCGLNMIAISPVCLPMWTHSEICFYDRRVTSHNCRASQKAKYLPNSECYFNLWSQKFLNQTYKYRSKKGQYLFKMNEWITKHQILNQSNKPVCLYE